MQIADVRIHSRAVNFWFCRFMTPTFDISVLM